VLVLVANTRKRSTRLIRCAQAFLHREKGGSRGRGECSRGNPEVSRIGTHFRLASYSSSTVTCTSFISVISVMTIARVPLRSNTIPLARTYFPTNGISFCR
jgi:hypothetical protein